MDKRDEIRNLIMQKQLDVLILKNEIEKLKIEEIQISDDERWYKEEVEDYELYPMATPFKKLIGREYWFSTSKDETTGEEITNVKNKIVRYGGHWLVEHLWVGMPIDYL